MANRTRREDSEDRLIPQTQRSRAAYGGQTRRDDNLGANKIPGEQSSGDSPVAGDAYTRFPSGLKKKYRVKKEFDARGGQADTFLISDIEENTYFAKIYRKGFEPKSEIWERLSQSAQAHVVRIYEHGKSDECSYEILEYIANGDLRNLINDKGRNLSSKITELILIEISNALSHVHHALNVAYRDLKPENVLIRHNDPLNLVLTDFGIASILSDGPIHYSKNPDRTAHYAPPEASSAEVSYAWDYWSLGMILVEILAGEHPFAGLSEQVASARLATHPTDDFVVGVHDPHWRKLCRGLLRRDPKKRWGRKEVRKWLDNPADPSLVIAEESPPAGSSIKPFPFQGKLMFSKEQLAAALGGAWDDALLEWKSGRISRWVRDELRDFEAERLLDEIDKLTETDSHNQLFRAISVLDPTAPLCFRSIELTESNITVLSEHAPSDERARFVLLGLFHSRILSTAGSMLGNKRFISIEQRWQAALSDYEGIARELNQHNLTSALQLTEQIEAILLSAATPNRKCMESLKARGATVSSSDAIECPWFEQLRKKSQDNVAALLSIIVLAPIAEMESRRKREETEERKQRERQVWQQARSKVVAARVRASLWCGVPFFICGVLVIVLRLDKSLDEPGVPVVAWVGMGLGALVGLMGGIGGAIGGGLLGGVLGIILLATSISLFDEFKSAISYSDVMFENIITVFLMAVSAFGALLGLSGRLLREGCGARIEGINRVYSIFGGVFILSVLVYSAAFIFGFPVPKVVDVLRYLDSVSK